MDDSAGMLKPGSKIWHRGRFRPLLADEVASLMGIMNRCNLANTHLRAAACNAFNAFAHMCFQVAFFAEVDM